MGGPSFPLCRERDLTRVLEGRGYLTEWGEAWSPLTLPARGGCPSASLPLPSTALSFLPLPPSFYSLLYFLTPSFSLPVLLLPPFPAPSPSPPLSSPPARPKDGGAQRVVKVNLGSSTWSPRNKASPWVQGLSCGLINLREPGIGGADVSRTEATPRGEGALGPGHSAPSSHMATPRCAVGRR